MLNYNIYLLFIKEIIVKEDKKFKTKFQNCIISSILINNNSQRYNTNNCSCKILIYLFIFNHSLGGAFGVFGESLGKLSTFFFFFFIIVDIWVSPIGFEFLSHSQSYCPLY